MGVFRARFSNLIPKGALFRDRGRPSVTVLCARTAEGGLSPPFGVTNVTVPLRRWRWQTQGTYFLGFNTILNWNDLDAGKTTTRATSTQ
jgi:hypothetical protein